VKTDAVKSAVAPDDDPFGIWEIAMKFFGQAMLAGVITAMLSGSASAEPRTVIELFTSQGCSSCPAADKLLGQFTKDSSVIALSLPVDYWDYLGWKDTLASPLHTAKQRAYARARGDREIYTPQAVVNGVIPVIGSDKSDIDDAVAQTRGKAMTLPVQLSTAAGKVTVSVPDAKDGAAKGEVWIYGVASAAPVTIGRGENAGRSVTYYNVTRRFLKLGDWDGKAASWTISADQIRGDGVDAVAVILQDGNAEKPGLMRGAALAGLR
jgi:hypothetical protein